MNIFALWGEIEINRKQAEQDIVKVEKQAEKSGKKMESSFDKVTKVVATAIKEVDKFGDRVETLGKNLSKKAGVPLAALTALMGGLAKTTADYTATVKDNAAIVGLSAKSYQELQYAMQQSGLSQDEYLRMMGRVNQRIGFARQGNEKYRKSLEKLGISLAEVDAGLVDTEDTFLAMIQYLHEMDDAQQQAAVAGDFFGVMLSRRMMPLIKDGAQSVEELRQRAHDLGLVMDDLAVAKGDLLSDTLDDLSFTAKGLGRIFGSEMHAPMINIANAITDVISGISTWLAEHPEMVRKIIVWGGAIAGVLGVLVTLGTVLVVTGKIIGALGTVFNILTSKPLLIIAAIGALYLAWENDWLGIKTVTETVVDAILALWDSLVNWWENDPLVQSMKQAWADAVEVWEELTLPEKTLGLVAVAMTITWALTFLKSFASALIGAAGITEATGAAAGLAKFAFTLGALVVAANIIWDLLPESLQTDVKELWAKVGKAIEDFNTETINNPFIAGIAKWLQNLDAEDMTIPTLTVTVLFLAFKLFQKGMALAAVLGKAIGAALGTVAIPLLGVAVAFAGIVWAFAPDEERAKLKERLEEIWADESLSVVVKVGKAIVEVAEWVLPNWLRMLGGDPDHMDLLAEYEAYRQAMIDEATKDMNWFQKRWWQFAGNQPEGLLSFAEWKKATGYVTDDLEKVTEAAGETVEAIEETADDVERLTGELSKLDKQALIVAETLRQGGTMEQAMAILGIAYWETRGHGGYTHTDPTTGEVMRGGAGEYGIGQVMPGTGKDVWTRLWGQPAETWDESMLKDLDTNIAMMVSYFLDRYQAHGEDLRLAIEGYNRGTAIDGMQAYTVGVVEWMEGAEGQSLANILYDGMENALEAMVQAGYDMDGDVREMAAFLAQSIADYLVGQSPPPEGPLSDIDEGGQRVMEAWVEGAEKGIKDGVPTLTSGLEKVKNLFGTIWGKVPEEIKGPIEQAMTWITDLIGQAEDALFKLDKFQEEIDALMGGGKKPEEEAKGFMERLRDALEDKVKLLDDPLTRFVDAVSGAALHLMEVVQLISAGDWKGAFLSILMETEAFAKGLELVGKLLEPFLNLVDAFLLPVIEFVAKTLAGVANFFIRAINGVIRILNKIPFVNIKEIKEVTWGEEPDTGGGGKGTGGRQVSEITGPTRDLLVDLLSPLANFGQIVAPIQDIRNILYERLPNFDAFGMDFAGAGAMGPAVVIENLNVTAPTTGVDDISRATIDQIERALAGRVIFGIRGRGGR